MKILIMTFGTRGDVQPYVALGLHLKLSGHDVTIATSERFRTFIEDHGLGYGYVSDRLLALLDTDEGKALLETGGNILQLARGAIKVAREMKPAQVAQLYDFRDAALAVQPDLIVYHPKAASAPHTAEELGVPVVLATPLPMYVPTSEMPFFLMPNWKLGAWYNRLTYAFIRFATKLGLAGTINDFRRKSGLQPAKFDLLKTTDGRDIPVLHAFSEAVFPRPHDWPEHARITGYWFLDEQADWRPSPELEAFLNDGPPPVYVGFGSMAGRRPERLASIVVAALRQTGLRGIIATGWGGLATMNLPETILRIDQAPHHWLFPRTAAVVHHGGAGTTAAGLRAGRPTIIVPFFADQPFWGRRVCELGAGPQHIPQKKLSVERLARALVEATQNKDIIATAAEIGRNIRSEDGVETARAFLESHARG